MAYAPRNTNGQATMANSSPVSIASDQTTVKTKLSNDVAAVTGTITAAASSPIVLSNLSGVASANITFYGTYAGVNAVVEVYDGVNWIVTTMLNTTTATVSVLAATGVLTANSTNMFVVNLPGVQQMRVRPTAWTSGTCNVIIQPSAQAVNYMAAIAGAVTVSTTTISAGTTTVTPQTLFRDQAMTAKTTVKAATNGRVYSYNFYNPNTTDVWVHFYAALIANVTVGTTVPVWSVWVPAGGSADSVFTVPLGIATGITVAPTTSQLHTGSTAPATGVVVEIGYI